MRAALVALLGVDRELADELAASMLSEAPGLGSEREVRAACARLW